MATKGKRPMRALTPGDKIEAIQRVNDGESKASVARDIGVPESTLRGWCKNEDKLRYMSSRLSSPDTDKSNDGEPLDKRARTDSPAAPADQEREPSPPAGLDLSAPAAAPEAPAAPVELTTRRSEPAPPRARDPGASVSMSAISPLSGLAHLPPLPHSHLGLSFNEIATNLTLLAQLNPGLSALSAQPAGRALRSVRSPKPAHNGALDLGESKHHRSKSHHADPYRHVGSKAGAHRAPPATQPVDDTLWYWLKTQQAMLDLSAQTGAARPLHLGKAEPPPQPQPIPPAAAPLDSHLDYNRNSWLWQYYKQFGGATPLPDDRHKPASQVPKDKAAENILYSHLTKGKEEDRVGAASPLRPVQSPPRRAESRVAAPAGSPESSTENKEPATERGGEAARSHTKARTVLDNLLFSNKQGAGAAGAGVGAAAPADGEEGAAEALQHGDKFLAWLEASGDPSVTRMHVHQLRALLLNLRARRRPPAPPAPERAAGAARN